LAEQTHSCTDEVKWRGEATVDSSTLNFTPIVAGWKKNPKSINEWAYQFSCIVFKRIGILASFHL